MEGAVECLLHIFHKTQLAVFRLPDIFTHLADRVLVYVYVYLY